VLNSRVSAALYIFALPLS